MSTVTVPPHSSPPHRMTPSDLEALPNEKDFELVDGQLVELNMGFESSYVGTEITGYLRDYVRSKGLGWVLGAETGYQCFPDDPDKVRRPDASFISANRLSAAERPKGYCKVVPDLVVEVISPNDLFSELSKKVEEYLATGVRIVWILDPDGHRALIYRQAGGGAILGESDDLSGEDVVPGFRCRLSELFAPPPGVS